ncbi:hypothetical protein CVT91_00915 [Candidatus Atribacteria bacterium HGW-Atribacteria-1]|nr:MAG: hypothetical protein CVT91_00915 [Candidatus Atribacteria bacterium HGW-Atribacteria-1]
MNYSIETILKIFIDWEDKNNLEKIFVKKFPIWFLVREELFSALILKDNKFKMFTNKNTKKHSLYSLILCKNIFWGIFKSIYSSFKKNDSEILAISYPCNRRRYNKGYYFDLYYDPIFDFKNSIKSYIFELPLYNYEVMHYKNNWKNRRIIFGDLFYLKEFFLTKLNCDCEQQIDIICNKYAELFLKYTGILPDLEILRKKIYDRFQRNLKRINLFQNLLDHFSPKIIILTSGYTPSKRILTQCAKKKGIKVIEFQHAHIYPSHIAYHYCPRWYGIKKYLPISDKLLVFGEFYKEQLLFSEYWNDNDLIIVGNPFNYDCINAGKNRPLVNMRKKFKYIILVISQYPVINEIIKFLKGFHNYPEILFVIKTHPNYYIEEEKTYRNKLNIRGKNLMIVSQGNIFDYLFDCDVSIGIYSSGLIDSISMDVPACVIDTKDNYKLLYNLVRKKFLRNVKSLDDFVRIVKSGYNKNHYHYNKKIYQNYSPQKVTSLIEKYL